MKSAATNPDGVQGSPFAVPPLLDLLGGLVHHYPKLWLRLGRLESSLLAEELRPIVVRQPIYICGLARSGSTLLHEVVSTPACVATHRVKDYPMVFTPYWWRRATANLRPTAPRERAHRDGMTISSDSPESLEEMLWMAFFPRCHDPSVNNRLEATDSYPAFESFHDAHLCKLLLAERATRYAAKANYHVARLPYLLRLYPDAKILLPVRAPHSHIASLRRQHQWFSQGERKHRRALAFMRRSGHFEFGLDRRPIHLGDDKRVAQVRRAWADGDEVRGLAISWDMVYAHLARVLDSDAQVRAATRVVRFETLCAEPEQTLRAVLEHCLLPDAEAIVARFAPGIRLPDYYPSDFSAADRDAIRAETAVTASLWGY